MSGVKCRSASVNNKVITDMNTLEELVKEGIRINELLTHEILSVKASSGKVALAEVGQFR